VFTEAERRVFKYQDAEGRDAYADPLAVHYGLLEALKGELAEALQDARSEDLRARVAAQRRLGAAVLEAFTMPPFDPRTGSGTTLGHCLDVLWDFLAFLDAKKKQPVSSPTCARPTAPASSPAAPSTSAPTSGCG
jgi:hypothetical protein